MGMVMIELLRVFSKRIERRCGVFFWGEEGSLLETP
jgi:hypothetical protein